MPISFVVFANNFFLLFYNYLGFVSLLVFKFLLKVKQLRLNSI